MSIHKHIDRICLVGAITALLLTFLFANSEALGIQSASRGTGYEDRLFDASQVHVIDIVMEAWDSFIETCENEEYAECSVIIDGETYKSVGIRAKGNTSLSTVSSMNSDRYSFKIEFDQYDSAKSYYGLDKLSLNNVIQDTTYMKDYLTYKMMAQFGVAAPLCSYVYIRVNGEDWGLYLAVEGIEEAFLRRNYGSDYGELYKPDPMNFGGGRGNGKDFRMDDFMSGTSTPSDGSIPQNSQTSGMPELPAPQMRLTRPSGSRRRHLKPLTHPLRSVENTPGSQPCLKTPRLNRPRKPPTPPKTKRLKCVPLPAAAGLAGTWAPAVRSCSISTMTPTAIPPFSPAPKPMSQTQTRPA